ncbi:hypothetical protein JOF29_006768 [Kribbella aluminosa]|uniref:Uncharacterized protein n=1 Tax=Kribbella aluminosa TaxID=416017 RepID=A0ABS4UVJ6_9ACTN|nr:hypothetical protein [Kribbella aluminosa]MBP2355658.1 hypothetical protein [Kribbella aluminosa]
MVVEPDGQQYGAARGQVLRALVKVVADPAGVERRPEGVVDADDQ